MPSIRPLLLSFLASPFLSLPAFAKTETTDPETETALAELIECTRSFDAFACPLPTLGQVAKTASLSWKHWSGAVEQLHEYRLLPPITVFGHATDRIALIRVDNGIATIPDRPDASPLGRERDLGRSSTTASGALQIDKTVRNIVTVPPSATFLPAQSRTSISD